MKERIGYLDIAKGILIILVVLGHAPFDFRYIFYWFHMPAFFIISGLLYKEKPLNIFKLLTITFIPYICFSIINGIVLYFTQPRFQGYDGIIDLIYRHIHSGKILGGVFWFIPVFFMTKVIFYFLHKRLNATKLGVILTILYIVAHIQSSYLIPNENHTRTPENMVFFWNVDVVMMSLWYYFIGYCLKSFMHKVESTRFCAYSIVLVILTIMINKILNMNYVLDMKYSYYKSIFLDTLIPVTFTVCVLSISSLIEKNIPHTFIASIGKRSLVIMYLHIPVTTVASIFFEFKYDIYMLLGVFIPYFFALVAEKNLATRLLFTGKS